jgi:hypothetical protein
MPVWYQYSQFELYSKLKLEHTFLERKRILEELFYPDPSCKMKLNN